MERIWDIITDPKEIEALDFFRRKMIENPKHPKVKNPYYIGFDIPERVPPITGIHLPKNIKLGGYVVRDDKYYENIYSK